ncbi:MAG: hypothetical protein ACLS7Y_04225, partial [Thomasclavelia spiroformis]
SNLNANVLFVKTIPSHGVKKGIIEDDRILTRDIQKVIKEAEEFLKTKITSVALTIPTIKAKLYQSDSSISLKDDGSKITNEDILRYYVYPLNLSVLKMKKWCQLFQLDITAIKVLLLKHQLVKFQEI